MGYSFIMCSVTGMCVLCYVKYCFPVFLMSLSAVWLGHCGGVGGIFISVYITNTTLTVSSYHSIRGTIPISSVGNR